MHGLFSAVSFPQSKATTIYCSSFVVILIEEALSATNLKMYALDYFAFIQGHGNNTFL